MTTVLFIHGTGTRETAYRTALSQIRDQLRDLQPAVRVEGFYWGGTLGTDLHFEGASIPGYQTSRGVLTESLDDESGPDAAHVQAEIQSLIWEQLERDPLFEFRQLGAAVASVALPPGAAQQWPEALEALQHPLATTPSGQELEARLTAAHLSPDFKAAVDAVSESPLVRTVLAADAPAHLAVLARALLATLLVLPARTAAGNEALDALAMDAQQRDAWAGLLAEHLQDVRYPPNSRGVVEFAKHAFDDLVKAPFVWSAAHVATWRARKRRRSLTDGSSAAVGDILWYQAHGRRLREEIARLAVGYAQQGPVVLLAHSLGGIACVDTLIEQAPAGVKLLITAGSQAPYFYEIGALASKPLTPAPRPPLPHALPGTFPRWLNFHDPRDLLSYLAAPIFQTPGAGVPPADHELDNGCSFPASHSAYWQNPALWNLAKPVLRSL
jgi:hypothetical protein